MAFETAHIQQLGEFQMIRIPETLKIEDTKVYLKRVGNTLYVIPFHNPWQSLLDSLGQFSDDFMEKRAQPGEQKREKFDE